jgi:AraC family transcriptional regulator of adaptative response/methylated-DNA-[protein]-cysteine methyltransferase
MTVKEKKANLKTRYATGGFSAEESPRHALVRRDREGCPRRRCLPEEGFLAVRRKEAVVQACRLIEEAAGAPKLADLAEAANMSRYHFHRLFKMVTGVTPKAYATAVRTRRVLEELARGSAVTEAIYGAGFNSSGRFYATSTERLGMTPTAFRAGGEGAAIGFAVGECSLGSVLVAATDKGVCAILLGDDPDLLVRDLQDRFAKADIVPGGETFDRWVSAAVGLVENPALGIDLPLDIRGTVFQLRVWEALRSIPPGSTASYTEIAKRIGQPKAARAVARACSANPIAVAIPCHRVVAKDKSLSGYRWGVERKAELLKREKQAG